MIVSVEGDAAIYMEAIKIEQRSQVSSGAGRDRM